MNLPSDLTWRAGVPYYRGASTLQKVLFVSGTLLFLSIVLHLVALVVAGGNLIVLHAVGVHGLLLVPLAAWLLSFTLSERVRTRLTAGVAGSFALLTMLAVQALRTLPLSALDRPTALLLGASTLLITLYLYALRAAWRGLASSATPCRR